MIGAKNLSLTLLAVAFIACVIAVQARTLQESDFESSAAQQGHERAQRDIEGMFQQVGNLFKKDENGQSPVGNLVQGFFKSVGGLFKPPGNK